MLYKNDPLLFMEAGLYEFSTFNFQFSIYMHVVPLHFIAKVKVIKVSIKLRAVLHVSFRFVISNRPNILITFFRTALILLH